MSSQHRPLADPSRRSRTGRIGAGRISNTVEGDLGITWRGCCRRRATRGLPEVWSISEIGDGNLNLVFIARGARAE